MGPSQSKSIPLNINHQRFASNQLKANKNLIQTEIPIDFSKSDFQYWRSKLEQIKADPSSVYLFLPESYDQQIPSFACSTKPKLKLEFLNYPHLLEDQIINRTSINQLNYFQEQQLWLLLYTLLKCQKVFANMSLKVGDIHPHNIFINGQGDPKLACQFSWPNEQTNFQKMFYDKSLRFLSPEEMRLCQIGQFTDTCSPSTSEAFSIGLTVMSAGLLQNLEKIVDLKTFKFNQKYLQYCINRWRNLNSRDPNTGKIISYSQQLKNIIVNLCKVKVQQRLLSSEIFQLLQPFETQILKCQKFSFSRKDEKAIISPKNQQFQNNQLGYANHKDLFYKYASLNKQIKTEIPLNQPYAQPYAQSYAQTSLTRENLQKQKNIEQIKRNLKLEQVSQSVIKKYQQKNQQTNNTYQFGNYKSVVNKSLFDPQQSKYINFASQSSYQPLINNPKQNSFKMPQPTVQESTKIYPPSVVSEPKFTYNNDFLERLQKQIRDSKNTFPQNITYDEYNEQKRKDYNVGNFDYQNTFHNVHRQ